MRVRKLKDEVANGADLVAVDLIHNGQGVSDAVNSARHYNEDGQIVSSPAAYGFTTNYLGGIDTTYASLTIGDLPDPVMVYNNAGLPGGFNITLEFLFEDTDSSEVDYIDSSAKPFDDCEGGTVSQKYGPWIDTEIESDSVYPDKEYLRLMVDINGDGDCPDPIELPCDPPGEMFAASALGEMNMTAEVFPAPSLMETAGPPLWADLHATAAAGQLTPEWLEEFAARIPCGICRAHWLEMLKTHPPRYDDQYAWSVEVHNIVNVRLGKPIWTGA